MKRKILISSLVVLLVESFAVAEVLHVPSRTYQTIQSAITAASSGDVVEVAPNPNPYYPVSYSGQGNWDLDFKGKAIMVRSRINPDSPNWDIIASTIIDCNEIVNPYTGEREPHRAVRFHKGEGAGSVLMGFTIKNGYQRGPRGADGGFGYDGFSLSKFVPVPGPWCTDVSTCPPIALPGVDATGNGYGGAILCEGGASPTIRCCIISDCLVTGARGGDGASGLWGTWYHWTLGDADPCNPSVIDVNAVITENTNGQWGGSGGAGEGNGYGGAIACRGGSSPVISDCVLTNNIARGGEGGVGGDGGMAADRGAGGDESGGGDGGNSEGDGMGGAIYAESGCAPVVVNCMLSENTATTGPRAKGGMRGLGSPTDPRAPIGNWGYVYTLGGIAGGGGYYDAGSDANFSNCLLSDNQAYDIEPFRSIIFLEDQVIGYTLGGGLYCGNNTSVLINTCDFQDNLGGAVWCGNGGSLTINNDYAVSTGNPGRKCLFEGNSDPNDWVDLIRQPLANYSADLAYGGALCVGTNVAVDISNSHFGGNSAKADGGAIKLQSSGTVTNCSFGGNVAQGADGGFTGFGGAVDAYKGSLITVEFEDCSFTENHALIGGGFSSESFDGTFTRCYFVNNTAENGGGMDLAYGTASISESVVSGNKAMSGSGGGLNCLSMEALIENSTVVGNLSADFGGGINLCGGTSAQTVKNCLIVGNEAGLDGGGVSCSVLATPAISNCTFSENTAGGFGGGVFSDWSSRPVITDCIFNECGGHAIHEEDGGGDAEARFCLFYNNADGDYYDSGTGLIYSGPGDVGSIPGGGGTDLYGEPLFAGGDLGEYYLSQVSAGQGMDSPAVDAGSATAASVGMNEFTTRTDNVLDSGQVDIGYHYLDSGMVATFELTTSVAGGQGTIEPASGTYFAGTVVTLTAAPRSGWRIKAWTGSDDDSSTSTSNTVIMNSDRAVSVEFDQPSTLIVSVGGGEGYYPTIQEAVNDARDGDTVVVYPGTYYGGYPFYSWPWVVQVDKSIEIRSLDPDDPATVAATIIDGYRQYQYRAGWINWGVGFLPNTDENTILNGFTIMNCGGYTATGLDGDRDVPPHPDGVDGPPAEGGGIFIASGAGPVIKNCVIRDNVIVGGNGGNGVGATDVEHAGRGGWGGWAWGAGVYCGVNSTAKFINCRIIDNIAQGGNGGDGGAGVVPGGFGNYGGNYSISGSGEGVVLLDPFSLNLLYVQDDLWKWFEWDEGLGYDILPIYNFDVGTYIDPFTNETKWHYFGDYRWYTGMGGGVFVDRGSEVTFTDCEVSGNVANGGMSGQGGSLPVKPTEPLIPYKIPSFGGGVYCAKASKVTFDGCMFANNTSDDANDPNHRLDPYLGHGGGVCAEDTAEVIFDECVFSGNIASVGGGLHFANANPTITDSEFMSNTAFHGGGVFGEHGPVEITGTEVTGNAAILYAPDPNIFLDVKGEGGGVHLRDVDAEVVDSNISGNIAETSGGGAFFGGEGISSMFNCLLAENTAGVEGGAVTNTTFSQLAISNCTLADNSVAGQGFGGGIYSSHWSYTDITDSIIWGNLAVDGAQVAVGTGFEYDQGCSTVSIWFSDIGPQFAYTGIPLEQTSSGGSEQSGGATIIDSGTIYDQLNGPTGRAEVIVSLFEALGLRAETDWTDAASIAVLQSEVASRQAAVLSTLTASDFVLRQQFKNQAGFSGTVDEAGLNKLLGNSMVQYIEPVRYMQVMMSQALALANAMQVRQSYDGTGVAVAIVDTGVDYRHPMLGGGTFPNAKVIGGYDTAMGDGDPLPAGDDAHGTACAGIAAGDLGNVGDYIGGVGPGARIYALKIAQDDGLMPMGAALAAWEWCVNNRIADPAYPIVVMSNSWGLVDALGQEVWFEDPAQADAALPAGSLAAQSVIWAGITMLAASGNGGSAGQGIGWPAAMSDVISVGAVYDTTDQVTGYSNTDEILDILAPADPIHTTDIVGAAGYDPGDYYPYFNGTSAACPFAAGAVAVLQQAAMSQTGTYLTPGMVRALLVASGEPVTDTKVAITKPRVNLGALLGMPSARPIFVEQGCDVSSVIGWDPNSTDPNQWEPDFVNYGNISEDPNFVDGYHLSQVAAGQLVDSPCVDAGSDLANNLGLDTYTTRTDHVFDRGIVDMGYHYPFSESESCRVSDLVGDGVIDFKDFAAFAERWLDEGCLGDNNWCGGADMTFDGYVDGIDLLFLTKCWLVADTEPPIPNPAEWQIAPYATSPNSIAMTARTSVDAWGVSVEYYFEDANDANITSGWISSSSWEDTGLTPQTRYAYRVKTRDVIGNETAWSVVAYATTPAESHPDDLEPPSPDPMQWLTMPHAISADSISMEAVAATDVSLPVEYYFEETTDNPGGADSGWVANALWTATGLNADTQYCYRVQARDAVGNTTGFSSIECATTFPSGTTPDTNAPDPPPTMLRADDVNTITDPCDNTLSAQYQVGLEWWHKVVADVSAVADDSGGPIEIRFICVSDGAFSSNNTIPGLYRPILIGNTGTYGGISQGWRLTYSGGTIIYDVNVDKYGGIGKELRWKVCAYDESMNEACSATHRIGPPPL